MIAHVILGFQKTHHCPKNAQIREVGGKRGLVVLVVSNSACVGVPGSTSQSLAQCQQVEAIPWCQWSWLCGQRRTLRTAGHVTPKQ